MMKFNGTTQEETDKLVEMTRVTDEEISAYNTICATVSKRFDSLPMWLQCELIGSMVKKTSKANDISMSELLKLIGETEKELAPGSEGEDDK